MKPYLTYPVCLLPILLAGCIAAPVYQRPVAEVPLKWQSELPWRDAKPQDTLPKGAWWKVFENETLDSLQQQALEHNQTAAIARARLLQIRALAQSSEAGTFPRLDFSGRTGRQQPSENRATYNASPVTAIPQSEHALNLTVSYELDLFGRVASDVAASQANAQQAKSELENTLLVLSADLATLYFNLCATDTEIDVVKEGIALQEKAISLLIARHEGGIASGFDQSQQQALLDATRTQLSLLNRQRLQIEHAIATLIGTPASHFQLATRSLQSSTKLPVFPVLLPSDILERRPDVSSAERAVAAANAQIGVARAASFPSISLGAGAGLQSRTIEHLLNASSSLWSFGSSIAYNVFDGGRNKALLQASKAAHEASVANYRQTVLRAFQEVEDGLGSLETLGKARQYAQSSIVSSQKVLDIATYRYQGGAATYLEVVTAQQNMLNNQRLAAQLLGQQLTTTAFLAKALGGSIETHTN